MKETEKRPRLKNLDELFRITDNMEQFREKPVAPAIGDRQYATVDIDRLTPFPDHPFRLYEGERLGDMVESIRTNGVLVPIIIRRKVDKLEILSGHNRVNAAKLAGHTAIQAVVLNKVTDKDALVYVIETNLLQRSFADMSHSEKAAVIHLHHSKMFSQGKRNDILKELQILENPHGSRDNQTFPQVGEKSHSDKKVAEMYSLSKNTVARYLRIWQLIKSLKVRLDNGEIAFLSGVTLSFLKEPEQELLDKCLGLNKFPLDMTKAEILRRYSKDEKLDDGNIYLILNGELGQKPKPNRTPTVKIAKSVYAKYFPAGMSEKDKQVIVEKALELYYSQQMNAG